MIHEMLVYFSTQSAVCEVDHLQKEEKCFWARQAEFRSLSDTPAECAFKKGDVLAWSVHHHEVPAADVNKRVCHLQLLSAHSKHEQASINHSHTAINITELASQLGHFSLLVGTDSVCGIYFDYFCIFHDL